MVNGNGASNRGIVTGYTCVFFSLFSLFFFMQFDCVQTTSCARQFSPIEKTVVAATRPTAPNVEEIFDARDSELRVFFEIHPNIVTRPGQTCRRTFSTSCNSKKKKLTGQGAFYGQRAQSAFPARERFPEVGGWRENSRDDSVFRPKRDRTIYVPTWHDHGKIRRPRRYAKRLRGTNRAFRVRSPKVRSRHFQSGRRPII